jgi:flagellar basal-body rod protein FlgB
MSVMGIGLLSALADKMRWSQTRQGLLAQNVANAETPNYRGRDLKAYSFAEQMDGLRPSPLSTVVTDTSHIAVASADDGDGFTAHNLNSFEITPEGNGVTLEDEMMKVTNNQMDYQAVTSLYTRSLALIRTAIGASSN